VIFLIQTNHPGDNARLDIASLLRMDDHRSSILSVIE